VAACGPGDCLEREGRGRRKLPAALFQLLAPDGVEARHICTRGTDTESKRLPPIVEARVLDPDGQLGLVDVVEAGGLEQLGKVARAGSRELGFVPSGRIELPNRRPEQAERAPPTGVVPDASNDDPARTGDSRHLAQAADGIRHEMDDKLRKGDVEFGIGKGQLLRGGTSDVDAGVARTSGDYEWLRRVDGGYRLGAEPRCELAGQGAGPATDVERSLSSLDAREVGELGRKLRRIAPHESVVRVGGDGKAHPGNVRHLVHAGRPSESTG
jgi:hypothetical protein